MRSTALAAAIFGLGAAGCVPPTTHAPAAFAGPALVTAHRAPLRAVYRMVPPPAGCSPAPDGPGAIVVLHGLGDVAVAWLPVLEKTRACVPRVLVDLPGLGDAEPVSWDDEIQAASVIDAIADVIDGASPNAPVVLAGHSLGGTIAVRVAAKRPDRIRALVAVATPLRQYELSAGQRFIVERAGILGPLVRIYGVYGASHLLVELNMARDAPPVIDEGHVGLIARQLGDARRRIALQGYVRAFIYEPALDDATRAADQVRCPVWAVAGGLDGFSVDEGRFARAASVTRVSIPGVGHLTTIEAPAEVAAALDEASAVSRAAAPAAQTSRSELAKGALAAGDTTWGPWKELHPVLGVASIAHGGAWDHAALAGVARGSIDRRWPLEAGRLVGLVGAAARDDGGGITRLSYLRATARAELVWRSTGGILLDGTFAIDPRGGGAGGFGAVGYVPSVIPFVRGFVGYGRLPASTSGTLVGVELDARLTGLLY